MKKTLILMMCLALVFGAVGCGKEDKHTNPETKIETSTEKENEVKNETETEENKTSESKETAPKTEGTGEAPVIESAEELEGIVDEFNTTEDPERKEELRKQLEAILSQAEAMAQTE